MKKYLEITKTQFKSQLVYRFDVALTAVGTIGRVLFAFILWGAIFEGRDVVGGFTYQTMLAYYLVSSFLTSLEMSEGISREVAELIRGGKFSKFMVIPSSPLPHFMAQNFGKAAYYAIFSAIATVVSLFVFHITPSITGDIPSLLCVVAMVLLGLTFMVVYQFFIGILAFKFQDVDFFLRVQGALLTFATGSMIPLSLLPAPVLWVLRFLPFTYVTYTPTMLLLGEISLSEGIFGLGVLAVWLAAMTLLVYSTYRRFRIKFDGVGI
ncbi:MAG: ABC transporter permease [Clostridiales bacterium]|nr:ABC transporter permease [Clostridiales bacterium]